MHSGSFLTLQGYPHREIMLILQVCSGFISKWKQEFIFKGVEGLKLVQPGGNSPSGLKKAFFQIN